MKIMCEKIMQSILKFIHEVSSKIISKGELRKMFGVVIQYLVLVYILPNCYLEENLYFFGNLKNIKK